MPRIFNRTSEKEKRRNLRADAPKAEMLVWSNLRRKGVMDHKFRRQYSIGPYVVDFYCPSLKLAVEIDGDSHFQEDAQANDENRQAFIESLGIRFLRFTNDEVFNNMGNVLEQISRAAAGRGTTPL